jgi:hypothetical protein
VIGLRTRAAKRREAAQQVRLSLTLERPFAAQLRGELERATKSAATLLRGHHDVAKALPAHRAALTQIFKRHYRSVSSAFFRRALGSAKHAAHALAIKAPQIVGTLTAIDADEEVDTDAAYADLWAALQETIATKVGQVSDTTMEQIQARIADGVRDGTSWDDIASELSRPRHRQRPRGSDRAYGSALRVAGVDAAAADVRSGWT